MIESFLLVIACIIGSIAAYEDIRTGRVRNKVILIGLLAGITGYLLLATQGLLFSEIGPAYFKKILINVSISWTISFFIWYIGLWSAGDAKIFMLLAFLLPLKFYGDKPPVSFFPAAGLLINGFIFTILFIILEFLFKIFCLSFNFILKLPTQKQVLRERLLFLKAQILTKIKVGKNKYLKVAIVSLCLFMVLNIYSISLRKALMKVLPGFQDFFFIILILGFRLLIGLFRKMDIKILLLFLIFFSISYFFIIGGLTKDYFIELVILFVNFIRMMLILFVAFKIIERHFKKREEIRISTQSVAPNMVLSKESESKINNYFKKTGLKEKFYADGLTPQQVNFIKELALKNSDFNELIIYKTFPLTPFIFLGILATVIARGIVFDLNFLASICRMIMGRFL